MNHPSALGMVLFTACSILPGCVEKEATSRRDAHEQEAAGNQHSPSIDDSKVVVLDERAIERSGIQVAEALSVPAAGGVDVPAEVQAEPDRLAHVSSVVAGQIARVEVSIGDRVKEGQVLAVLRSVALGEARAQAQRARANVEVAEANFQRHQELKREGIGAERQFLEAQAELRRAQAEQSAAQRALEVYGRGGSGSEVTIRSPITGRVIGRHATVGEVVEPADVLFEITDISEVWVVGRVYQQDAGKVQEGAPSVFTLPAVPDKAFSGKLDYVAPSLDEHTRTLPVRLTVKNSDGQLRPGLFGTLSVSPAEGGPTAVAVAAEAVQRLGSESVVFVPEEKKGVYRAVPVTVGSQTGGLIRLNAGLKAGDPYVVSGGFVLKSELSRAQLGEGHAH